MVVVIEEDIDEVVMDFFIKKKNQVCVLHVFLRK